MLTGTEVVVTLPEVYFTVLDTDCLCNNVACETIYTEDHDTSVPGDQVKVEVCGGGIKAYASEHVDGENNPDNKSLTDDQESYTLTLGFKDKESFCLAPDGWDREPDVSAIHARRYHEPVVGTERRLQRDHQLRSHRPLVLRPRSATQSVAVFPAQRNAQNHIRRLLFCTMKWDYGHAYLDIQLTVH